MARKQAQRRKRTQNPKTKLPKIRLSRVITPLVAVLMVAATYRMSTGLLDRNIDSIEVTGPFQRVSALQIEEAVSDELDAGFLGADLGLMQAQVRDLPWIDQARVARRWPNRISIQVSEQIPAAIWGESGLLNVRGELFVDSARHIPAELPRLSTRKTRESHSFDFACTERMSFVDSRRFASRLFGTIRGCSWSHLSFTTLQRSASDVGPTVRRSGNSC